MSLRWDSFETSALEVLPATVFHVHPLLFSPWSLRPGRKSRAGRSRGFQDPGIGHRRSGRASAPDHHRTNGTASPADLLSPSLLVLASCLLRASGVAWPPPRERQGEGERERKHTPGITATVDAARYFWRQVDMSFTCTTVGCWLRGEKGVPENVANTTQHTVFTTVFLETGDSTLSIFVTSKSLPLSLYISFDLFSLSFFLSVVSWYCTATV